MRSDRPCSTWRRLSEGMQRRNGVTSGHAPAEHLEVLLRPARRLDPVTGTIILSHPSFDHPAGGKVVFQDAVLLGINAR